MYNVRQVLNVKGQDIWFVSPEAKALDALHLMADKNIGALLVLEGQDLVGIVSERDFVRLISRSKVFNSDAPVNELMTKVLYTVTPDDTMENCMSLMTQKHIRHLPVLDKGKLVGIISIGDVVKEVIATREEKIQSLENYIMGEGYGH